MALRPGPKICKHDAPPGWSMGGMRGVNSDQDRKGSEFEKKMGFAAKGFGGDGFPAKTVGSESGLVRVDRNYGILYFILHSCSSCLSR